MKNTGIDQAKKVKNRKKTWQRSLALAAMALILTISMSALSGCRRQSGSDGFSIVCTNFPSYDFARQLTAGTEADITLLLSPGAETHSYEPTPQDIIKIQNCDIFICTGGESESWIESVLASVSGKSDMTVIKMLECVTALEEEPLYGITEDDEHGNGEHDDSEHDDSEHDDSKHDESAYDEDEHNKGEHDDHTHGETEGETEYDEHVWTSPKNAILISEKLENTLSEKDPENADTYSSNLKDYKSKLEKLDSDIREAVNNGARKTLVFGDRYPFLYFAKEYGLTCYAAFPGCSSETEPIPSTVAFLIDKVKSENIPIVLYLEMSNTGVASAICESTGAEKMLFHSCHNVSKEEFESGATYLSLMENNLEVLKKALG